MKINKNQFTISNPLKQLRFHYHRGRGHLFFYLRNRVIWHYYPRLFRVASFPDHVDVEISTHCNMNCPMCYTRTDAFNKNVKKTFMSFDLFKKIVDECALHKVFSIRLSLRGEAFIHPNVIEMIAYAKKAGIKEVSSLTNLMALDVNKFRELVRLGLDWLTISFDGIGKIYENIRKPAKFDESYEKIRQFKQIKKEMNRDKPVIKIQTVWPAIKENPAAFMDAFEPYVDQITVNPLVDYLHKDEDIVYINGFICPVPWQRLVVGADGRVLQCSNDEMGKGILGDLTRETIRSIWQGTKLNRIRTLHKEKSAIRELRVCQECHFPRKLVEKNVLIGDKTYRIKQYANRTDEIGR